MTCNNANKYYAMCSSYLGIIGSIANYHCLLCNETNTNTSSEKLTKFVCPKTIGKRAKTKDTGSNVNQLCSFTINFL